MVIVRLMGGLGNQMFQYAVGRRLSLDSRAPLKLDLSWFDDHGVDTKRTYQLDGWRTHAQIASSEDLAAFGSGPRRLGQRVLERMRLVRRNVIKERKTGFSRRVLTAKPPVYLSGYWQNEQYFKAIEMTLRGDFQLASSPCKHVLGLVTVASRDSTVSIHIRRGDYVNNPVTNAAHGTCSVDYYLRAVRIIVEKIPSPTFLVFGDDLDWAKDNLKFPGDVYYVSHAEDCLPHHDIWLMSHCNHHVIANSSFSWWGAWLSKGRGAVIAPKRWLQDESHDCRDTVPVRWETL